ncbi:Imm8 family immunity protein [Neisseria meningitidis]
MIVLTLIWKDFPQDKLENFCILLTLSIGFDERMVLIIFMFIYIAPNGYFSNIHRPMSLKNSIVTNRFNTYRVFTI